MPLIDGVFVVTDEDCTVYDFGKRKVWPKPELKTPYQVIDHYAGLVRRLSGLGLDVSSGREDHMVKSLDILAFALREVLFQSMVLREAITGYSTKELELDARKGKCQD